MYARTFLRDTKRPFESGTSERRSFIRCIRRYGDIDRFRQYYYLRIQFATRQRSRNNDGRVITITSVRVLGKLPSRVSEFVFDVIIDGVIGIIVSHGRAMQGVTKRRRH